MSSKQLARRSNVDLSVLGGALVPVSRQVVPKPDGTSLIQLSLDMTNAPVPERRYTAEVASVVRDGQVVRLMFGQKKIKGKDLKSLLIVSLYPEAVGAFFRASEDFMRTLAEMLERNSVAADVLEQVEQEPEQAVILVSNLIAGAYSGREAVLDFYHLSPMTSRKLGLQEMQQLPLDAIVRVDLPTTMMAGVLHRLNELRPDLPAEMT